MSVKNGYHINGLVQERHNSIANTLDVFLALTLPYMQVICAGILCISVAIFPIKNIVLCHGVLASSFHSIPTYPIGAKGQKGIALLQGAVDPYWLWIKPIYYMCGNAYH